jgi:hypothetical protein
MGPKTQRPEPVMNLPQTVAEVLREHVTLECESIDRMYLIAAMAAAETAR